MNNILFKLSILTLLLASNLSLYAQDIELHIGKETIINKNEFIISIHQVEDGIILLKTKYKEIGIYHLEKYDSKMNFVSRKEVVFPDKDLDFFKMIYLNDKIYLFLRKLDKRNNINAVYGTTLSKDGKFETDIFELVQFETESRKKINPFSISLSADSTHFMIQTTPPMTDKDQMAVRHFLILDLDFKEVDNILVNFPFEERDFSIDNTIIDHSGNLHMLSYVAIEETRRNTLFKTSVESEARVFSLYKGESDIKEYKMNFLKDDAGFISQIQMKIDKLGRLQCSGFYSDQNGNSTRGIFVFTIDLETKEISNISSQEFTDEYLNEFMSEKQIERKERDRTKDPEKPKNIYYERLYNYKIRDLIMKKDGGFYLVAEYYLHTISYSTDPNGLTTKTHLYDYNDLMVISVLTDNTVDWFTKVSKKQHASGYGTSNFGIKTGINNDNSLNILFNDNMENINEIQHNNNNNLFMNKSNVVLVKFEENGNGTKTVLLDQTKSKIYFWPNFGHSGKENDIILMSQGKKTHRFTNVIFK